MFEVNIPKNVVLNWVMGKDWLVLKHRIEKAYIAVNGPLKTVLMRIKKRKAAEKISMLLTNT